LSPIFSSSGVLSPPSCPLDVGPHRVVRGEC
jgi:hypothetical protein